MIVILSQDPHAIRDMSINQANASQAVFGPARQAFQPMPPLGATESLFILAEKATRAEGFTPAIGDEKTETYWNPQQVMTVLNPIMPANYTSNVYVAATDLDNMRSNIAFAAAFKSQLVAARRGVGKVFGQVAPSQGPLPPPGDPRWIEVQAA